MDAGSDVAQRVRGAKSIDQFCTDNGISRAFFYIMPIKPRMMHVGRLRRISPEAETDWQRECEEAARQAEAADAEAA
jgi:hypothetical protein